jgi:hypothetical protein
MMPLSRRIRYWSPTLRPNLQVANAIERPRDH